MTGRVAVAALMMLLALVLSWWVAGSPPATRPLTSGQHAGGESALPRGSPTPPSLRAWEAPGVGTMYSQDVFRLPSGQMQPAPLRPSVDEPGDATGPGAGRTHQLPLLPLTQ